MTTTDLGSLEVLQLDVEAQHLEEGCKNIRKALGRFRPLLDKLKQDEEAAFTAQQGAETACGAALTEALRLRAEAAMASATGGTSHDLGMKPWEAAVLDDGFRRAFPETAMAKDAYDAAAQRYVTAATATRLLGRQIADLEGTLRAWEGDLEAMASRKAAATARHETERRRILGLF